MFGVRTDELDNFAVTIGGGFFITPRLVDHPQTIVSVMHFGIAIEELTCSLLGLIEFALVDEVNDGIGVAGQLILVVPEATAEVTLVMVVHVIGRRGGTGFGRRFQRSALGCLIPR